MKKAVCIKILLAAAVVMVAACVRNEFSVEFSLPESVSRTYTVIYYAASSGRGRIIESVINVEKGHARYQGVMRDPCLASLMVSGAATPQVFFYLERGDKISVTGSDGDPVTWKITGNRITDALTDWRLSSLKEIREASKVGGNPSALNRRVSEYVKSHPDDPVSTLLLLCYYDRGADESGFRSAWAMLRDNALKSKWLELVSRNDMLSDVTPLPDRLNPIVLKSLATGCDTIVPGRVPAIIYFARNTSPRRDESVSGLRELLREYKDSSRRVVASVSFEPDSSAFVYQSRDDSLTGAVKAWMPLGVSDRQARELQVSKIPFFLVIGANGKVRYSGSDTDRAIGTFRQEMR